LAIAAFVPAGANAAHHLVKISEVYPGSVAAPAVEFVELQLTAAGENQMTFGGGSSVTLYSAAGTMTASGAFASNPPNSESQRTILVGTSGVAAAFGVTPDLELLPIGDTLGTSGSACFNSVPFGSLDCVGWGAATQPGGTSPFGTPELDIPDGSSLARSIASGNAGLHEFADDTNDSSADFSPDATPTPCPNSAAQPACNNAGVALPDFDGDGVPDQSDQCPTQAGPAPSGCPATPLDGDGDGKPDASDVCPNVAGAPANGCPGIARTLSLRYNAKTNRFFGKLGPAGRCAANQKVKIFRKKAGPDPKVTSAITKPTGKYSKVRNVPDGKYYSKVEARTVSSAGNCFAKRSKTVVVG
jgi:hypothetical protein